MDPTDESRRKPRRTRGTPSYYYRNRFACAVIVAGTALFYAWTFTPIYRKSNEKLLKAWGQRTEEEIERRYLFSLKAPRTSQQVEAHVKENEYEMER